MPPGGVDRNGNLKLCSKSLPVFKQFKAMKSSGEKEHWTWTASKPFLPVRPVPFLLTHLSQTVTRDTHFPLYSFPSVPPDGKVGWWKGLGDPGIRISPTPLSVCPCAQGWPCVPGCTHKHRGVFLWPPQTPHLAASLSFPLCPSALDSSLTHTPARSHRSSLWFALHRFAPSSLLLSESPGSFCIFFRLLCASRSHMAWGTTEPSGHLGYICKCVAPLPAAAWGPFLLSCPPSVFSISVALSVAAGPQHSSGFDWNCGPAVDFQSLYQPAQGFL